MAKKPKKKSKPKKLYCPQCGAEVSPGDEFSECGKLLLVSEAYDAYADFMDEEVEEDV